ncbi:divalent cation tolerance protein CutA [Streptomyces sp. bgisy084]|uniref:divalent cation tolerance protein CutA n=1 Tax=unclassified Streptomyces TaxID=2593676 RepID=UPI003D713306
MRWLSHTKNREAAVKPAQSVVSARLAAGAQIVGPVGSVFWHQGEFGSGEEWQLVLRPGPVPVPRPLRVVHGES